MTGFSDDGVFSSGDQGDSWVEALLIGHTQRSGSGLDAASNDSALVAGESKTKMSFLQ